MGADGAGHSGHVSHLGVGAVARHAAAAVTTAAGCWLAAAAVAKPGLYSAAR